MVSKQMHKIGSSRSCIRNLFEYGKQKAAEIGPENVMDFSIGNPSIPAPQAIEDAIKKLIKEETAVSLHSYTSAVGDENTRKKIAESLSKRFNANIKAKNLFIIGGAAPALIACFKALTIDSKDEFVSIAPYFPEYRVYVENGAGAVFKVAEADLENFQINFEALENNININTRAVILNSPNNPSGAVYTKETLQKLSELLKRKSASFGRPIYLVSDEPYRELVYRDIEVPYIPDFYNNTIICYSYSKSLSLPGERIGYVLVPSSVDDFDDVFNAITGAARAIGHVCAPSLMQKIVALCCDVKPDKSIYEHNGTLLYEKMTDMGYRCVKPDGAFYLFFEAPGGLTAQQFSDLAKEKYNLLIVPGDDFGCPTHLRMSYCVPTERIEQALPILEKLIKEVK